MNPLYIGIAALMFFLLRKKPPVVDNTTPAVVPFTPENINAYQNLNTSSTFDNRLAKEARRVTPDGTGKNIVDGTYKCFAPGNQARRNAIIKVYQDLERLRTKIANTNDSERKREARRDLQEKDDERAILVAQHYMICEAFLRELQNRPGNAPGSGAPITTAPNLPQERGAM